MILGIISLGLFIIGIILCIFSSYLFYKEDSLSTLIIGMICITISILGIITFIVVNYDIIVSWFKV